MKLNAVILVASALLMTVASFGCASTLSVRSEPAGAEVSIREMGSSDEKVIGTTPLVVSSKDLAMTSTSKPFVVRVHHPENSDKTALISRLDGQDIDLFLTLEPSLAGSSVETSSALNTFIDDLFRARSLANLRDFAGALALLNKLAESHPRIAAVYELRGSVFILKNEIASAVRDYNVAVQLNPTSLEASRVQRELQALSKGAKVNAPRDISSEKSKK